MTDNFPLSLTARAAALYEHAREPGIDDELERRITAYYAVQALVLEALAVSVRLEWEAARADLAAR